MALDTLKCNHLAPLGLKGLTCPDQLTCSNYKHYCAVCRYYQATVDEILDDGTCSVIFDKYNTTEVTQVCMVCRLYVNVLNYEMLYAIKMLRHL